jgi:hypothetical protein
MIRKLIGLLVLITISIGFPAQAQQSSQSYSVAFGYKNGIRVATIAANGTLSLDFIPGAYYKQGDVALVNAVWNGNTLYYVTAPSDTPEQFRYVYAYDRVTKQKTPVVFLKAATQSYDYAVLNLAPNGRYLWLYRVVNGTSRLLDTQAAADKRVSYTNEECPSTVQAWTDDAVFVYGFYGCYGLISVINQATGKVIKSFQPGEIESLSTQEWHPFKTQPSSILVDSEDGIYRISQDSPVAMVSKGAWLKVSKDGKIAAFWNAGKLYQISASTGKAEAVVEMAEPTGAFAAKDTVGFWALQGGTLTLTTLDANGTKPAKFTVMAGATLDISPDSAYVALIYRDLKKFSIYGAQGKTFESSALSADLQKFLQLPKPSEATSSSWWKGWYFASVTGEGNLQFAINAETGKVFQPPPPQTQFVGGSPDGVWWLFTCMSNDEPTSPCGDRDRLAAVNIQSGKTLILADDVALEQRNFHFPPFDYYAWMQGN